MKHIKFTKDYTLNAKGIAIIMMCVHHLFSNNAFLTLPTKVCVAIFTILSGYGINESYKKKRDSSGRFVWTHIKRLMINYWYVFIPMTLLSVFCYVIPKGPILVYGTGIKGCLNFLLDFFGVRAFLYTPSLNNTWWYMEAILFCYILFPLIKKGVEKRPLFLFTILIIPNILAIWNERMLITTDRELFYILPFALGIFCSEKKMFDKLVELSIDNKYKYITVAILVLVLTVLFAIKVKLIGNILYAISVISISIWGATNLKTINKVLVLLGKHSMNIFLSHSFFYIYLIPGRKLMNICKIPIVKLIVLIIVSLLFSIFIENIKNIVNKYKIKESINNDIIKQQKDNEVGLKEKLIVGKKID